MSSKQQSIATSKHFGYDCQNCRLRLSEGYGSEECMMEATRDMWANPHAVFYCDDPHARKFVQVFNIKQAKVRRITALN